MGNYIPKLLKNLKYGSNAAIEVVIIGLIQNAMDLMRGMSLILKKYHSIVQGIVIYINLQPLWLHWILDLNLF